MYNNTICLYTFVISTIRFPRWLTCLLVLNCTTVHWFVNYLYPYKFSNLQADMYIAIVVGITTKRM